MRPDKPRRRRQGDRSRRCATCRPLPSAPERRRCSPPKLGAALARQGAEIARTPVVGPFHGCPRDLCTLGYSQTWPLGIAGLAARHIDPQPELAAGAPYGGLLVYCSVGEDGLTRSLVASYLELVALGVGVMAVSTLALAVQRHVTERKSVPFALLSDERLALARSLGLPTTPGTRGQLYRPLVLPLRAGRYPVEYPARIAGEWVQHEEPNGASVGRCCLLWRPSSGVRAANPQGVVDWGCVCRM
jgi:hypothetical protein